MFTIRIECSTKEEFAEAMEILDSISPMSITVQQPISAISDRMVDVRAVASRLGVSDHTVRNLVSTGKLPFTRVGAGRGVLRFHQRDVDVFRREFGGWLRGRSSIG
jgi:excisionase family DNA binding protein